MPRLQGAAEPAQDEKRDRPSCSGPLLLIGNSRFYSPTNGSALPEFRSRIQDEFMIW